MTTERAEYLKGYAEILEALGPQSGLVKRALASGETLGPDSPDLSRAEKHGHLGEALVLATALSPLGAGGWSP